MAFDCRIEPDQHLGTAILHGTVDACEFVKAMSALYGHPEWKPHFNALWDGSRIEQLVINPTDLDLIAARYREVEGRMGRGRAAFVMPREVANIITKLLIRQLHTPARERRTFEQVDEALAWLNDGPEPEEG